MTQDAVQMNRGDQFVDFAIDENWEHSRVMDRLAAKLPQEYMSDPDIAALLQTAHLASIDQVVQSDIADSVVCTNLQLMLQIVSVAVLILVA